MQVKFKRLIPEAVIPTRADNGSAGWDLYVPTDEKYHHTIEAGETYVCKLGFAVEIVLPRQRFGSRDIQDDIIKMNLPDGYQIEIRPRSGNAAKKSLGVLNSPGTLDETYRGEVGVILHNHSNKPIEIHPSDRIAQMVLMPYYTMNFIEVEELSETDRGQNGFGSTGN